MEPHSSILARKIPQTEELVGYSPWVHEESDVIEHTQSLFMGHALYLTPWSLPCFESGKRSRSNEGLGGGGQVLRKITFLQQEYHLKRGH